MKGVSLTEAVHKWTAELNAIPQMVIKKLSHIEYDEVVEVTPFKDGDIVYQEFPTWGTMWTFSDCFDKEWLEKHLAQAHECGFRIYYQEDYGFILGIDGAGYDFYEAHWIPLYKSMGLKLHDQELV